MRTVLNIFLLVVVSFLSGSVVTYFFLLEYPRFSKQAMTILRTLAVTTPANNIQANNPPILPPRIPGTVLEPDPYAQTPKAAPDQPEEVLLPQAGEEDEIIDLLRTQFIDAPTLIGQQLTPDTLGKIFAQYSSKIKISKVAVMTADPKIMSILQVLDQGAIYWRPTDFSQKELDNFLHQWEILKVGNSRGLIVDLRNFRDGNNLQGAASMLGLFISPQEVLFTAEGLNFPQQVFRSQHQPLGLRQNFPIVVLVNGATRGGAEAAAFVLQQKGVALVIGKKTAGEGGLFTETRLKSGRFIRLATARLSGFDGSDLLGAPLTPDVEVDTSEAADNEAFQAAYLYGIQSVAALKSPDRKVLKEREEMDLPLENVLPDKAPYDMILNVANDVLAGISLSQTK